MRIKIKLGRLAAPWAIRMMTKKCSFSTMKTRSLPGNTRDCSTKCAATVRMKMTQMSGVSAASVAVVIITGKDDRHLATKIVVKRETTARRTSRTRWTATLGMRIAWKPARMSHSTRTTNTAVRRSRKSSTSCSARRASISFPTRGSPRRSPQISSCVGRPSLWRTIKTSSRSCTSLRRFSEAPTTTPSSGRVSSRMSGSLGRFRA